MKLVERGCRSSELPQDGDVITSLMDVYNRIGVRCSVMEISRRWVHLITSIQAVVFR